MDRDDVEYWVERLLDSQKVSEWHFRDVVQEMVEAMNEFYEPYED